MTLRMSSTEVVAVDERENREIHSLIHLRLGFQDDDVTDSEMIHVSLDALVCRGGTAVQSLEKDSEGKPLLQFFPPFVSVRTISQLSKLLQLAADRKRQELQACLEENRDLIAKIVGQRLVNTPEENLSALELDIRVKLFILLKHIDEKILNKFVGEIAKQVKLLPTAVEEEVEFLKQYCTEGGKRLLKSLRYTSG
ncbi:armadillo repeat-containing protein 4-like [Xiphophorus hellerii]|uniref:armadillo repeat-containing protein 4-like n=1 Tax=Xiphophorus hellerii TaxID=8084 RepID=UPI0013B36598|nr:armadillo repeat-containing protein 4-like [Xiphophorus hellerii]